MLKFALCGRPIPKQYADFVNVDADAATLEYEFTVKDTDKKAEYNVGYSFSLKKEIEKNTVNVDDNSVELSEEESRKAAEEKNTKVEAAEAEILANRRLQRKPGDWWIL